MSDKPSPRSPRPSRAAGSSLEPVLSSGPAALAGPATPPRRGVRAAAPIGNGAHVPALVIGTGYGGSVAALRLAQAGVDVHMIEMGMAWDTPGSDGKIFCQHDLEPGRPVLLAPHQDQAAAQQLPRLPDRQGHPQLHRHPGRRGLQRHHGLPGPRRRRRLAGQRRHGGHPQAGRTSARSCPSVDADEMYDTYYPRANAGLGVGTIDPAWFETTACYQYARVGRKHAQRAGFPFVFVPNVYDWDYMKQEAAGTVPKSALAGEILYGNNHGKKSAAEDLPRPGQGDRQGRPSRRCTRSPRSPRRPAAATRSSSTSSTPPAPPWPPRR